MVADKVDGESFGADFVDARTAVIDESAVENEIAVVKRTVVEKVDVVVLAVVFFDILTGQEIVFLSNEIDIDVGHAFDDIENGNVSIGVDDDETFLGGFENFGDF